MMESGPVGGIIASARVGQALGFANVISFDMGGTTAKASLVRDGEPTLAPGYYVGGYASGHPVMLPMIDVVEVGAGGGSIAWIDDVGALKVGPQSAGADPGPICYRGGGTEPTITDANVVLGRLDPHNFLGGEMMLDADGARAGIEQKIADPLGHGHGRGGAGDRRDRDLENVARGARSVGREGLRSARLRAGRLRRRRAAARLGDRARAAHSESDRAAVSVALLRAGHAARRRAARFHPHLLLRSRGRRFRRARSPCTTRWQARRRKACGIHATPNGRSQLDLRYVGQEFTLAVPVSVDAIESGDRQGIRTAFDALYEHRYAHQSPDEPVEMVNIRLAAIGKRAEAQLSRARRRCRSQARRGTATSISATRAGRSPARSTSAATSAPARASPAPR